MFRVLHGTVTMYGIQQYLVADCSINEHQLQQTIGLQQLNTATGVWRTSSWSVSDDRRRRLDGMSDKRRRSAFCSHTVLGLGQTFSCFSFSLWSLRFLRATALCYSAYMYMLSPVRLSVRPSVRPSHGCIIQKRLKLGLWNFHLTVALSL